MRSHFAIGLSQIFAFIVLLLFSDCKSRQSGNPKPTITMDLSFKTNPTDLWQMGYSADNTLSLDQFKLSTFADTSDIIALWHPTANALSGYYPYVGQNRDNVSRQSPTKGWAVRAGQIAMEGSNSGQYSLVRFITPVDGAYKLKAVFEGVHFGLSSTDVHVLINSKQVFGDIIEGYGGDPGFHVVEGSHPSTSYEGTLMLKKNDIITFATGYGQNHTHFGDTTGLLIQIELL